MTNYFKIVLPPRFPEERLNTRTYTFAFDHYKIVETAIAWRRAMEVAEGNVTLISVYELPFNAGPWDRAGIVGHRRRGEILASIQAEERNAKEELAALDRLYSANGRTMPLDLVAAIAAA